jgi:hypothetical protein
MGRGKIRRILDDDIRAGAGSKLLAVIGLVPLFLLLLIKFGFLPLSRFFSSTTGFDFSGYYSLIALTAAAVVSSIPGVYFAFICLQPAERKKSADGTTASSGYTGILNVRAWAALVVSFVFGCLFNIVTDPIPAEGPLRMIYVSFLLSFQSLTALVFIVALSRSFLQGILMSKLYGIMLIVLPIGLVLESPWNILVFFSPYYWIAWAWLTEIPLQAFYYGAVSIGISFLLVSYLWHIYRKKRS